jgi:hypothetical protein
MSGDLGWRRKRKRRLYQPVPALWIHCAKEYCYLADLIVVVLYVNKQ